MRPSLQNSAFLGQHQGDLPIIMGTWQKSDAPALQAGLSGSVTRRSPPAFARRIAAGEGCRAEVRSTQAGMNPEQASYGSASHLILNCGKLDQCTERSLINFFRWV